MARLLSTQVYPLSPSPSFNLAETKAKDIHLRAKVSPATQIMKLVRNTFAYVRLTCTYIYIGI